MKFRNGFVSNSSSSSFIVGFDKTPESQEELRGMLFPGRAPGASVLSHYGTECYDADMVSKKVWKDMEDKKPLSDEEAMGVLSSGWFDGYPDYPDYGDDGKTDWEAFNEKVAEAAKECWSRQKGKLADKVLYEFVYSDGDGSFSSALEHGGTFDGVEHIQISHH